MKIWIKPEYKFVSRKELCRRGDMKLYRMCWNRTETGQASMKRNNEREDRKLARLEYGRSEAGKAAYRKYKKTLKGKIRDANWYSQNPEKTKAYRILSVAIRNGSVIRRPCSICGNPKSHGHHSDYSRPLEVQWLCHVHHMEVHNRK